MSDDRPAGVGRLWPLMRRLQGYARAGWEIPIFVGASLASGVAEAGVIVVLASAAVTLAQGAGATALDLGPLGEVSLDLAAALWVGGGTLVVLLLGRVVAAVLGARMATRALVAARMTLLATFLNAAWEVQAREREGHLHELAAAHTMRVAQAVHTLAMVLANGLGFAALAVAAIAIDAITALVLLGVTAVLYVAVRPLIVRTREYARRHLAAHNRFVELVNEVTGVLPEIRVFGVGDAMLGRLWNGLREVATPHRKARFLSQLMPGLYVAITLGLLLVGLAVLSAVGASQIGTLGAIVLFMLRGMRYTQQIQTGVQLLHEQAPFIDELDEAAAQFGAVTVPDGTRELERVHALRLENAAYEYPSGERALSGVNLTVHAGEVVGIVGPSGSGKTTLVQLLLGLRRPTTGRYLINDVPVEEYRPASWFRRFAYVGQEPRLISGGVADNVRFLREELDPDAVDDALDGASLSDDLHGWAHGADRGVGHRGGELSGGQRQRVALARALVGAPDVLILDEPTSALDHASESRITETIAALRGRVTVVIVAHRPSTLTACDRIVTVQDGQVVRESAGPEAPPAIVTDG